VGGYPLKFNKIRTEGFIFPKTGGKFGKNARGTKPHHGWDLTAQPGTPIYAVGPGKVWKVVKNVPGYGTIIQLRFLKEAKIYFALYAHLSEVFVKKGAYVSDGQCLGLTGDTGKAKGGPPHLHFEIATSENLKKGRENMIDPGKILGSFLNDYDSGGALVIESSFPLELDEDEIEAAERASTTA